MRPDRQEPDRPDRHRRGDFRLWRGGTLQALPQALHPAIPRGADRPGPDRCGTLHAAHPQPWRLQTLRRPGQCHRTRLVGYCGQGGWCAGLQTLGWQGARPGPDLQWLDPAQADLVDTRRLCRKLPMDDVAARGVRHHQTRHSLPQPDEECAGLLLRRRRTQPLSRPCRFRPPDRTQPGADGRLRRGHEGCAGRQGGPRTRLRPRLAARRCPALCPRDREIQRHVV